MEKQESICFIGKYSFLTHKGGIETFSKHLLKNLNVRIFAVFFDEKKEIIRRKNMTILHITQLFNFLGAPFNLLPFKSFMKHSLIHLNVPNPLIELQLLLYFLIRGKKQKLLITYHAEAPHYTPFHWFFDFLRMFWFLPLLIIADKIVATTNEYVRGSFILRKFKKKIEVIHLGLDFKKFRKCSKIKTIRKKLNIKKGEKIILFVGRLFPYKGLEYLLQAFEIVSRVDKKTKLIIVGKGRLKAKLIKIARNLKIDKKVIFTGEILEREKNTLYKLSDIFVLPSINKGEAFGLSMVEAMYFGKPVISTNIKGSGVNFVNLNRVTGLVVEPKNSKALAEAILKLLRDKNLRKKLGRNARERAVKLFDGKKMIEKYEKLYSKLMKG